MYRSQNVHGKMLRNQTDIGFGIIWKIEYASSGRMPIVGQAMGPNLIHGEPEICHYLFKRETLIAFKPFFRAGYSLLFFLANPFVFDGRVDWLA